MHRERSCEAKLSKLVTVARFPTRSCHCHEAAGTALIHPRIRTQVWAREKRESERESNLPSRIRFTVMHCPVFTDTLIHTHTHTRRCRYVANAANTPRRRTNKVVRARRFRVMISAARVSKRCACVCVTRAAPSLSALKISAVVKVLYQPRASKREK